MRSLRVVALFTFLPALLLSGVWANVAVAQDRVTPRTVGEVLSAWQDSGRVWASLPEEAQEAKAKDFLSVFSASALQRFCRETADDEGALERNLEGLVALKLRLDPLPASDLATLLEDLDLRVGCHKAVVQHLGRSRDSYEGEERERLADALLELADRSGYPPGIKGQLESAAATFTARDDLLERMRSYSESEDENTKLHGITLMSQSCDPRARDLLMGFAERHAERGKVPTAQAMGVLAEGLGPRIFEQLLGFRERLQTGEERYNALKALARTGDPRVFPLVLESYDDESTGIRNNTSTLADDGERKRYFKLYVVCRILEPTLLEALTGDDPVVRDQSVAILDRESRFGVAEDMEGVLGGLRGLTSSPDVEESLAERLRAIVTRFQRRDQELAVRKQQKKEMLSD